MRARKRFDPAGLFGLLVVLCLGLLAGWHAVADYFETLESAGVLLTSLARSADEQISGSLRAVDFLLRDIAEEARDLRPPAGEARLEEYMRTRVRAFGEVRTAYVMDRQGLIWATTYPQNKGLVSDFREYFKAPRDAGPAGGLYISPPQLARNNMLVIFVSRAIFGPGGDFRGVVGASLSPRYFEAVLGSALPPGESGIRLVNLSGTVLTRLPDPARFIGATTVQSTGLKDHLASGQGTTLVRTLTELDDRERLIVYRTVGFPGTLVVAVSLTVDSVLAPWGKRAAVEGIVFLAASGIVLFLVRLSRRRARKANQAEQQIIELTELNQGVIANSQAGILAYRAEGPCVLANEAASRITGGSAEQLLAQDFRAVPSWKDSGLLEAALRVLEGGRPEAFETRLTTSFGRDMWVLARFSRFHSAGLPHLLLLCEDVTQRKQAEAEQARLLGILDAARDLVGTCDAQGRVTYMNLGGRAMLGIPEDEDITQTRIPDYHTPENARRILEEALPVVDAQGFWEGENEFLARDGRVIPVSQVLVAHRGPDGRVERYSTIVRDVSERRKAEETARRLAAIVESTDDAVLSKDVNCVVTSWNRGAERTYGYTAAEMVGQSVARIIPPEMREEELERLLAWTREGRSVERYETVRRRKDGQDIQVALTISPLLDPAGRVVGTSTIARDITAAKRVEGELLAARAELRAQNEALEVRVRERTEELGQAVKDLRLARDQAESASRAKSDFLSVVSHELRTPMNGVLGFAELLGTAGLPAEPAEWLAGLKHSAQAMLGMVNGLIDFSRLDAGRMESVNTVFPVQSLLSAAFSEVRRAAEAKGLSLRHSVGQDVPEAVEGDAQGLIRVLGILLDNAVKFSEAGEVSLLVSRKPPEPGETGIWLVFEVRDQGIGIAQEDQVRIFEPFTQVDGAHSRRHGGSGLGLAIAKRLAVGMGGDIRVQSEPGHGSSFFLLAPLIAAAI